MIGKTALVTAVRARVPELTAARAAAVVDAIFAGIAEVLARGEEVAIPRFGTFRLVRTAGAGRSVAFTPGRAVQSVPVRTEAPAVPDTERGDMGDRHRGLTVPAETSPSFSLEPKAAGEPYAVVEVFFATDRKATGAAAPAEAFAGVRGDGKLAYGRCRVSIPRDHRIGHLEKPSLWRFEFRQDPEKHVVLLAVERQDRDGFFAGLAARVRAGERPGSTGPSRPRPRSTARPGAGRRGPRRSPRAPSCRPR